MTIATPTLFWEDLAEDLKDPEFLREYVVESVRIATIDRIINALDDAREAQGLTKADVARAICVEPATIRRFLAGSHMNPTLSTVSEVAAALGFRISLEPLRAAEKKVVTRPLREGKCGNPEGLVKGLAAMHEKDFALAAAG
ncbi:MAG: DNA-binding protein [Hyphomicrobiales bacterium]